MHGIRVPKAYKPRLLQTSHQGSMYFPDCH